MIIECGKRRLVSERFCWKIEILHTSKKGKKSWKEDRPAYPATLAQALEMVYEREIRDMGDMACTDVVDACKSAYHAVRQYAQLARESA